MTLIELDSATAHHRNTQRLRRLPASLAHRGNIEHLVGGQWAPSIEEALADYATAYDLLALINRTDGYWALPHLELTSRPALEGDGFDVGWRIFGSGAPKGCMPELILRGFSRGLPPIAFTMPLVYVVANAPDVTKGHVVYSHSFRKDDFGLMGQPAARTYVGVTRRGWRLRYGEHLRAARTGSPYHFHRALRDLTGQYQTHQVQFADLTFRQAMEIEEKLVDLYSLYPAGLNMIPGGFAGMRYLAKHGFSADRKGWEDRHLVLERFAADCDRAGRPNPLAAAAWRDDAYAASVICNNPNNFDAETVRTIRRFGEFDWPAEKIAERVACRPDRVRRLLSGSTYERVR